MQSLWLQLWHLPADVGTQKIQTKQMHLWQRAVLVKQWKLERLVFRKGNR